MRRIALSAVLVSLVVALSAPEARADSPLVEGPFEFPFATQDFFAGTGQSCGFRVVGSWDVVLNVTTFFHPATGTPSRIVSDFSFAGMLSNATTGASVLDFGQFRITEYYAPDGAFLGGFENEVRHTPLLRAAFHVVVDAEGNLVLDAGRDWLTTATVVIDIGPLCAALS